MTVEPDDPRGAEVDRLAREVEQLRRLHEATVSLVGEMHPLRPVQALLRSLGELLGTSDLFVAVVQRPDRDRIEIVLATGSLEPFSGLRFAKGEGVIGRVWRDGRPLAVEAYDAWPGRSDKVAQGMVNALAAVPMRAGTDVVGVLGIHHPERPPDAMQLAIAEDFARIAALALERARVFAREREARRESEVLRQASLALSASLDLPEVLDLILEQVRRVVPCDTTSLMELHGRELVLLASKGFPHPERMHGLRFDLDDPERANLHAVIETRQPLILEDAARTELDFEVELAQVPIRSWLGVPLLIKEQPIGVLTLDRQIPDYYDGHHASVARSFASQAAVAIDNARLYSAAQAEIARRERVEAELKEAKEASEAASRAKSSFLATMSHELRTPMNAVLGLSELLLDGTLEAEQRSMVQSIRTSGRALLAIITDVLDFSKIEADRMEVERRPFVLRECVDAAVELVRLPAREKGLDLEVEVAPEADGAWIGDRQRLRQVLANLLSNAVKFTESGEVRLTVEPDHDSGATGLRFSVRDTGIGIPASRLRDLFQPFSQIDPSFRRRVGGSGLGLSISRRLVEMMGGDLRVVSTEGEGSTFWFRLPLEATDTVPPPPDADRFQGFDRDLGSKVPLDILLVEDSLLNREVAILTLKRLGYAPDWAASGAAALERLRERPYDLILMDVEMPGMDGLETTRRIRAELPPERQPRIVAMTAGALIEDRERCLAAGMEGFLSKPIELHRLQQALLGSIASEDEPAPDAGEELPVLDPARVAELDTLRRRSSGPSMADRLLSLFLEEVDPWSRSLETADVAGLARLAHEIRGAALQLGAKRLGELATRCREETRLGTDEGIQWARRRLAVELEAARAAIAETLETMREPR